MNPGMIQRAIARHRHMQDLPAYREFLEHVRAQGDSWQVPQAEIAQWWESRQRARIRFGLREGVLQLECPELDGACVQLPETGVSPLPLELPLPVDARSQIETPRYDAALESPLWSEILGHLGYGHLEASRTLSDAHPLSARKVTPLLESMRESLQLHQRLPEQAIERLHDAVQAEHRRCGLIPFRLWSLPHASGRPYLAAVSTRYDVDKAIVNLPLIHDLEESFGLRSTVYLRPLGLFYGRREIVRYARRAGAHEIALHGEFLSNAERFGGEAAAALQEKRVLEEMAGVRVHGVCMHGGELRSNTSPTTRDSVEAAGYAYETMYRNRYHLPLHLPHGAGVRRTLSIGQHYMDVSVKPGPGFADELCRRFEERYAAARAAGGVFVPVMHPLYFDLGNYLRYPENCWRLAAFVPKFVVNALRMRRGQNYLNKA